MKPTKIILILMILIAPIFITGCVEMDFDCMILPWIPGTCSASSGSSTATTTTVRTTSSTLSAADIQSPFMNMDDNPNNLDQNRIDNLDWNCDHIPNSYENEEGTCVCKSGYGYQDGRCVRLGRFCKSDLDCGSGVRSRCSGTSTKIVYRCDLREERCLPEERVSCSDYGTGYTCVNGECRPTIIK